MRSVSNKGAIRLWLVVSWAGFSNQTAIINLGDKERRLICIYARQGSRNTAQTAKLQINSKTQASQLEILTEGTGG